MFRYCVFSLGSAAGISFVLVQWLDKMEQQRQELSAAFMRLQFFAKNVKARGQLSADQVERIEHFVQAALACHLDLKPKKNANVGTWNEYLNDLLYS